MKKLGCLLLSGIMVGSMTLPVFGWTSHPVDMSKVDVLIEGEKVYDGQTGTVLKEPVVTEEKTYNLPNGLKGFKDVPNASFWAYDAVMSMTEMGLFSGTTAPDSNGMGLFSPDYKMTKAQFITVVTRYLFANSLANMTAEGPWYAPNWNIAVEMGILTEDDFGGIEYLNTPISRQEMAYIITNVLKYKEDLPTSLIDKSQIADYHTIGGYYADYARTCYSAGILAGIDMKGTFAPLATVTRAQGAVILYRLVNPDVRVSVDLDNATNDKKDILTISKKGIVEIGDFEYPGFESLENKNTFAKVIYDFGTVSDGETTKVVPLMKFGHNFTMACEQVRYADILYIDDVKYECETNEKFIVFDIVGYNEKYEDFNITDFYITLGDKAVYPDYEKEYKEMGLEIFTHTNVEIGKYMSGYAIFKVSDEFLNTVETMRLNFYHHPTCDMIPSIEIEK